MLVAASLSAFVIVVKKTISNGEMLTRYSGWSILISGIALAEEVLSQ